MLEVLAKEDVPMKKIGGGWYEGFCPFHDEKSPSFQVGSKRPDRATCRGCGWSGDIYAFWAQRRGVTFKEATLQLAGLAGFSPPIEGVKWTKPKAKVGVSRVTGRRGEDRERPALPRMRALRDEEIEALAQLRGLSVAGVQAAARVFRRVGFCEWPQWYGRDLRWRACDHIFPSWVVTDESRWVAQFRRLDGEHYPPGKEGGDPIKCWTKGSPTWPLGAAEIGQRVNVLLVEGGADMLAAYHFLHRFRMLERVAVCCMLGAGNRIASDALPFFKGKRIRIIADADEVKEKVVKDAKGRELTKRSKAGLDAALRWQEQLSNAGGAVKTYQLEGLLQADGERVKDLNNLAACDEETIISCAAAFTQWKEGFGG